MTAREFLTQAFNSKEVMKLPKGKAQNDAVKAKMKTKNLEIADSHFYNIKSELKMQGLILSNKETPRQEEEKHKVFTEKHLLKKVDQAIMHLGFSATVDEISEYCIKKFNLFVALDTIKKAKEKFVGIINNTEQIRSNLFSLAFDSNLSFKQLRVILDNFEKMLKIADINEIKTILADTSKRAKDLLS